MSQVVRLPPDQLPGKGDIVAIDAEFVSLMVIREWIYLCTNLVGVGGWVWYRLGVPRGGSHFSLKF